MHPPKPASLARTATDREGARPGGLDEYRRKRDFGRTAEPSGDRRTREDTGDRRFVIQKHAASRLHFDLRLEQDGVLKSWAVPKGPSLEPGEKRLAVQVEDHPLEYADFEGVIPQGEYGGGTVMLWDEGRWHEADDGKAGEDRIDFVLEGRRLRGGWTLTRMSGRRSEGGKNWLLIKRHDDDAAPPDSAAPSEEDVSIASGRTMEQIAADPDARWTREGGREPRAASPHAAKDRDGPAGPDHGAHVPVEPPPGAREATLPREPKAQLATLAREAPAGDGWLHEIKFDGYRILARWDGEEVRLFSRNGKDWTDRFPEIAESLSRLPPVPALLDGEVVALESDGSSSFRRLQEALSEERTRGLVYQVFDLLHLRDHDLTRVPLEERKRTLHDLMATSEASGERVRYTDHIEGKGPAFLERACGMGLEGIISKRRDAPYAAGRNKGWLKAKCTRHRELVIGGYTDPAGSRTGFGALLLGAHDDDGRLVYVGKVGTGFDERRLLRLHEALVRIEVEASPFEPMPKGVGSVHWVRPVLVAEVEFTEWTGDGMLRHPTFRGLREDKEPTEIRLPSSDEHAARPESTRSRTARRAREGAAAASGGGAPGGASSARAAGGRRKRASKDEEEVAGVWLSSPHKVLYPEQNVSKLTLARYYEEVADRILPYVRNRPLSLVRCPQGFEKGCFYQKHPGEAMAKGVPRVLIDEKDGSAPYLYVRELPDLIALVQAGVLELHVWGSHVADVERPDLLVFDLDPGSDVPWEGLVRVARDLRDRLDDLGLSSFPRTTGGKGLHLVVPLEPKSDWEEAKAFARAVAQAHAHDDAKKVTINMAKSKRAGRIFLDYLRNGRGATAIASYSTRSREGAPVAVPVRWSEVGPQLSPDRYHVGNLRRRLSALRSDPWEGFEESRRPLSQDVLAAVGLR